jgi:hypothetical protein
MAITITTDRPNADDLLSPRRPLKIRVTSNSGTISKMKCFIHLDGSGTADNATSPIILTPDIGTTNEFTFDISSYIDGLDTLSSDIQTKGSAISFIDRDTNSIKSVYCNFTELNLSSGLLVDGDSSTDTPTFYCINGVWDYDQTSGTAYTYNELDDYKIATTGNKYFLTNNRNTRTIGVNESEYLSGFTTLTGTNYIVVTTYSGRNATGSSSSYLRSLTFNANRFDIPVGCANINATSGSWLDIFGSPTSDPTIDSSVGSYKVYLVDNIVGANVVSEVVTYNVDHSCSDNYTRIKFLNRLGAFEYFTFKGYRNRSINVRKNYYQSVLDDGYSIGSGGDRALSIDSRSQFEVYSQPLKEADRIWLEEMLEGMECFVEEGSNYIPIKVRAGGTKIIDEGNDLFTFKMTYEYANPNRRQNG